MSYIEEIIYEEAVYNYLKTRLIGQKEKNYINSKGIILKFLEALETNKNMYKKEILGLTEYSAMAVRPILDTLYATGFIENEIKGTLSIYYINENGKKLLKELREDKA